MRESAILIDGISVVVKPASDHQRPITSMLRCVSASSCPATSDTGQSFEATSGCASAGYTGSQKGTGATCAAYIASIVTQPI